MSHRTRGATLVELALVLVLLAILTAFAVPRAAGVVNRFNLRSATQDVVLGLAAARAAATRARVVCGGEVLFERDLARRRGVRLEATRESVTFAPTGLGWGAANTTIVVSRGGRADTITTSRLGRVRHN